MQNFFNFEGAAANESRARELVATSIRGCGTTKTAAITDCGTGITQANQKMRMSMGKFFSYGLLLLAFWAITAMNGVQAQNIDQGTCGVGGSYVTWVLASDYTLTISGSGAMADYLMDYSGGPSNPTVNTPWYSYRNAIRAVVIDDYVVRIGDYAFAHCGIITSVTIPENITSIGNAAFQNCGSLHTVNLNAINCTTAGSGGGSMYSVFSDCNVLTTLNIGNRVKIVPNNAFSNCLSLTTINFLDSVVTIGGEAFSYCWSLTSVTIPNSVTTIGNGAFGWCRYLTSVIFGNSVATIGNSAFDNCWNLTSVTFGSSITSIGTRAFRTCRALTSVTIPSNITSIGYAAFAYCNNLTSINVDIGNANYLSDNGILFNKSKTILMQYPMGKTDTTYTIPNDVTSIENYAFAGCSTLTSISIPSSVTNIGDYAFGSCFGLTSIVIPDSVTTIGEYAFSYCSSLSSVSIGNSVTDIKRAAFRDCTSLTSITIPNSTTWIRMEAFSNCSGLISAIIGKNVKNIESYAFENCTTLTSITVYAVNPPVLEFYAPTTVFRYVPDTIPVYVPCGSISAYQDSAGWNAFSNYIGITTDTTLVVDTVCYGGIYNGNGFTISEGAGIYYNIVQSCNGCDSVICLTLEEYPFVPITNHSDTICQGESYVFLGKIYTESGTYYDTLQNMNGCDSIIEFTLDFYPQVAVTQYSTSICEGEVYEDDNFNNLTLADVYYLTLKNENGCDSVIEFTLNVNRTYFTQISDSIYTGNSYDFFGKQLTADGTYYDTLQTIHGCDSIFELTLSIFGVGIVETQCIASLRIYPNPAKNQLIVVNGQRSMENIKIYNVVGQVVLSTEALRSLMTLKSQETNETTIDVSGLANGMYFLKVGNQVVRFLKE